MWWFYTVILGMSFAQVLQELALAVRERFRDRTRKPYLPAMSWQIFLLVLIVEVWLAATYYRDTVEQISVLELLGFLLVPAGILVMSFLLPEAQHEGDPSEAFAQVRSPFFGVLIAIVAVNLLHGFLIGQQGWDVDLLFQCLIIAGAMVGLMWRGAVADLVLAVVMIGIVATYIGVGYSTVLVDGTG